MATTVVKSIGTGTVVVTDAFTDTAGTTLTSHTASDGSAWVNHAASGGATANIDASGRVVPTAGAASIYYLNKAPASADYFVQADVFQGFDTVNTAGLVIRCDPSAITLYVVLWVDASAQWQLIRYIAGTPTVLSTYSGADPLSATRRVKLVAKGNQLAVLIDGVQRITYDDTVPITNAGFGGIAPSPTTGNWLDAFVMGVPRDYSTLQAWEDACPADLTAVDQIWKGECYNDSEFVLSGGTMLQIAGITADATRYVWLTAAAGHSFQDHATKASNALKYDASKGVGLRVTDNYGILVQHSGSPQYCRIERLQFYYDSTYNSNYYWGFYADNGAGHAYRNCLFQTRQNSGGGGFFRVTDAVKIVNCAFISVGTGPAILFSAGGGSPGVVANCTFLKAADAASGGTCFLTQYGGTITLKNTAVFGPWATHFGASTITADSDRIYTDAASVPAGTNHVTGLSAAGNFIGTAIAAIDARVKAGAALIGAASVDTANTNDLDIIAQARSTTAPTIGAWESTGGGAPAAASLLSRGRHMPLALLAM